MRKRKVSPSLIEELNNLQKNRADIISFTENLLKNISSRYQLIRGILDKYKSQDKDKRDINHLQIASGLYISSLVSCWETFFRDAFISVYNLDSDAKDNIDEIATSNNIDKVDIIAQGIDFAEYMSKQYNFQSLNDLCEAFNHLYGDEKPSFYEHIDFTSLDNTGFSSPNHILHWLITEKDVKSKITQNVTEAFTIRHQVIHDANYRVSIDANLISAIEDCFIIIPQMISIALCKKYNQALYVVQRESGIFRLSAAPGIAESYHIFSRDDFTESYTIID